MTNEASETAELRVKIRETTRLDTFTVPHTSEEKYEFFHGKPGNKEPVWEELHVVCKTTKQLLARYSRAQVFALTSNNAKRAKSHCGVIVTLIDI
jgi:hypothetical protein